MPLHLGAWLGQHPQLMIIALRLVMQVEEEEFKALITKEVHGQPGMIAAEWMYWDGIQQPKGPVSLADLIYCMANGTSPAALAPNPFNTLFIDDSATAVCRTNDKHRAPSDGDRHGRRHREQHYLEMRGRRLCVSDARRNACEFSSNAGGAERPQGHE